MRRAIMVTASQSVAMKLCVWARWAGVSRVPVARL
jgi:hypothetical protein